MKGFMLDGSIPYSSSLLNCILYLHQQLRDRASARQVEGRDFEILLVLNMALWCNRYARKFEALQVLLRCEWSRKIPLQFNWKNTWLRTMRLQIRVLLGVPNIYFLYFFIKLKEKKLWKKKLLKFVQIAKKLIMTIKVFIFVQIAKRHCKIGMQLSWFRVQS